MIRTGGTFADAVAEYRRDEGKAPAALQTLGPIDVRVQPSHDGLPPPGRWRTPDRGSLTGGWSERRRRALPHAIKRSSVPRPGK